jgi:hypothetical protein
MYAAMTFSAAPTEKATISPAQSKIPVSPSRRQAAHHATAPGEQHHASGADMKKEQGHISSQLAPADCGTSMPKSDFEPNESGTNPTAGR